MRLAGLSFLFVVLCGPAMASGAGEVRPSSVTLDYEIDIVGLEALAATVIMAGDTARYHVDIRARTTGMIGWMFPWVIGVSSNGNITDGRLQPVRHEQTSNFQGKDRSVFLEYDGHGGFLARRVVPDPHEDQREEVPAAMTRDTLDIISAVLAGLHTVDRTGSCNGRVPVFDGRRRFDLLYSDNGREHIDPNEILGYGGGEALRCAIRVEPIAGYWRKNQQKFFTHKVNGRDEVVPIEVDVARVGAAGIEVPVRVESVSPYGKLVLSLQSVHD
jgi:hypothetical protein